MHDLFRKPSGSLDRTVKGMPYREARAAGLLAEAVREVLDAAEPERITAKLRSRLEALRMALDNWEGRAARSPISSVRKIRLDR